MEGTSGSIDPLIYENNYPQVDGLIVAPVLKEDRVQELIQLIEDGLVNPIPSDPFSIIRTLYFNLPDESHPKPTVPGTERPFSGPNLQFRTEYRPFIETNIRSYLPYNDANSNREVISEQFFNQEANVVSIESLEELHQRVINRGRGSTETLTYLDRTIDNIPALGTKVDDFVLSSAQHVITRTGITSDYNFDEFFAKLNKFVAVLEEYRQFSVPNENLVKRQFNREVFGKFRKEPTTQSPIINLDDYIGDKPVKAIQFIKDIFNIQILPVVATPFNNQIRFEAETATNVKTGDRSEESDSATKRRNEPVIFTEVDDDGRATGFLENLNIRLLENFTEFPWTRQAAHNLPNSDPGNTLLYSNNEPILKDPREILRYTFSIHHIDDTQSGRITKK